jgi:hypothetical protein
MGCCGDCCNWYYRRCCCRQRWCPCCCRYVSPWHVCPPRPILIQPPIQIVQPPIDTSIHIRPISADQAAEIASALVRS